MFSFEGESPLESCEASRYTAGKSPQSNSSFRNYHKGLEPQENLEGHFKLMNRMPVILFILVLVLAVGGVGVLAKWDIPAPVNTVEKVLPDERFPR